MKRLVIATCAGACAAPTVQMELQVPTSATMADTSCVTGVEVRAMGTRYAQDPKDFTSSCIELTGATYAALDTAMHDRYVVTIPSSGLAGVEVRGFASAQPCEASSYGTANDPFTPDLAFFASSTYIGQGTIELAVKQNVSCARTPLSVHVTDLIAVEQIVSPNVNPTDANCANATAVADGTAANGPDAGLGTLVPDPFAFGAQFFGYNDWAVFTNGLSRFTGFDQPGSQSCIAISGSNNNGGSTSCAIDNPVCAAGTGELELVAVPSDVITATDALKPDVTAKFPGIILGAVWTGTTAKHAVSGATLTIDAAHGTVFYVDPPAAGSSTVTVRSDQSGTGPSGMFLLYTNTVSPVVVKSGSAMRTVMLSATPGLIGGALVLVN